MAFIPRDQVAAAREMDLLTYLRKFEPQELVHKGGNVYSTRTHDSLKISNGKWCWWSRNIGGKNALDYLTKVEGVRFWTLCSVFSERHQRPPHRNKRLQCRKLNLRSHPNTPTTGVFFRICMGAALPRRSSITVSKPGSSMRTASGTTVCSSALKESCPGMRPCGERSQKSGS